MTYGEAFDFCMAGGKVRATNKDGGFSWIIWYDDEKNMFATVSVTYPSAPATHSESFLSQYQNREAIDNWTFEDADPKPPFEVRAAVDDDSALCVSIFWRGGLVIGTNRDDAVQLYEALGAAIKCAQCGAYLERGGDCHDSTHKGQYEQR